MTTKPTPSAPVLPIAAHMHTLHFKGGGLACAFEDKDSQPFGESRNVKVEPLVKLSDALKAIEAVQEDAIDAQLYRWLMNNCGFGIRRNGVTELTVALYENSPDSIHDLSSAIDAAITAKDAKP